ncbi:phosphoribosylglycinamide formyltransferase [Lasallia pustulata]|uniref:Phosphoribosylglycinamide formyltransferase n=1 Tax=Lasallia pustulata TaxID=136370 RepID=A0A1W5CRI3_9LECA|nr:phosphoribosylglycinamide formyltransferase [Lasallia pustulata]
MSSSRITVLISGNGTNLQALIDACSTATIPNARIVRVISDRKAAYGLTRAAGAGIPTCYHNFIKYKKEEDNVTRARETYDQALAEIVLEDKPDLVVCAGWMRVLTPAFLDSVAGRGVPVINLHPALPGQYNGTNAIGRAYEDFQHGKIDTTGVMIHYVITEVDMGEPILVEEIGIRKGESLEELEQRIHQIEWVTIVEGTSKALERLQQKKAPELGT